jgi:putative transposase
MTAKPVAFLLAELGVTKSHSRPHVSNDNPYSKSQFRTMKYRPTFPDRFGSYQDAHAFCGRFFGWYNDEHRHSGIGFHTPADVPLRPRRARQSPAGSDPQRRLRRASRALRPQATRPAGAADRGVDQPAEGGPRYDTAIPEELCLRKVDTRRPTDHRRQATRMANSRLKTYV